MIQLQRIELDVLTSFVQVALITNDMLIIRPLPDRYTWRTTQRIYLTRGERLKSTNNLRKPLRIRRGGFETRPYGICVADKNDAMHMIRHDYKSIKSHVGIMGWQSCPYFFKYLSIASGIKKRRPLASADGDEIGARLGVIIVLKPEAAPARPLCSHPGRPFMLVSL